MRHLRLVAATLLALVSAHGAWAANCSSNPFTLANGQTADATQVMSNFNNLLNCANNNLAHNGANSDITSLSALSTPLSVAQGGTGASTLTLNNVILGNGTAAVQFVAPSTSGNVLTSNGSTWVSALTGVQTIVDATNGGLRIVNPTTTATINIQPSDLLVKTAPTSADFIIIADVAASSGAKATIGSNIVNFSFINHVYTETSAALTISSVIPYDDTIPQSTEGTQILSANITPRKAGNIIHASTTFWGERNAGCNQATVAIFQSGSVDALAADSTENVSANFPVIGTLATDFTALGTTPLTFTVRVACDAGSFFLNSTAAGARRFGGVGKSTLTLDEYPQ